MKKLLLFLVMCFSGRVFGQDSKCSLPGGYSSPAISANGPKHDCARVVVTGDPVTGKYSLTGEVGLTDNFAINAGGYGADSKNTTIGAKYRFFNLRGVALAVVGSKAFGEKPSQIYLFSAQYTNGSYSVLGNLGAQLTPKGVTRDFRAEGFRTFGRLTFFGGYTNILGADLGANVKLSPSAHFKVIGFPRTGNVQLKLIFTFKGAK